MNGRVIAGAVLVLVIVVGGIFLLVGSNEGGQSGAPAIPHRSSAPAATGLAGLAG